MLIASTVGPLLSSVPVGITEYHRQANLLKKKKKKKRGSPIYASPFRFNILAVFLNDYVTGNILQRDPRRGTSGS